MSSSYKSNRAGSIPPMEAKLVKGLINMAGDILRLSTPVTPYKHGDLRVRRRVRAIAKGARIEWLSGHAAVQNKGSRKGHPFRNYTTPGTGPHFVEAGIKAVKPNVGSYFK